MNVVVEIPEGLVANIKQMYTITSASNGSVHVYTILYDMTLELENNSKLVLQGELGGGRRRH